MCDNGSFAHRDLHSFPTRRSSDLSGRRPRAVPRGPPGGRGDRSLPRVVAPLDGAHLAEIGSREARLERSKDRKSTRLNSSHPSISYAVFCLKKKTKYNYSLHTYYR